MDDDTEDLAARLERLAAENAALRRDAHVHRLTLESIVDYAVFASDIDLRVIDWNAGGERLLGWSADEIIGQPGQILFTPEDRARRAPEREAEIAAADGRAENERWHQRKDGSRFWGSGLMMPIRDGGRLVGYVKVMRDRTERRRAEQAQTLLMGELSHRVKNTLALTQALAEHTLRSKPDPAEFAVAFRDRLSALARAHDLLTQGMWDRSNITDVVSVSLGAWMPSGRISARGPEISLTPQQAMTFSLGLHELATNAAKYGALSVPEGRVEIAWSGEHEIRFTWMERGGPPVTPPTRSGFGSVILGKALASAVAGEVKTAYPPQGFEIEIRFKRPAMAAGSSPLSDDPA